MITLDTGMRINSDTFASFSYDSNKLGSEILAQVLINMKSQENEGLSVLLLKNPDSDTKLVKLDRPFSESKPIEKGILAPSRKEYGIKISNDYGSSRTISLDLTVKISELMPIIAEKMRFYCQSDQYCLWYVDELGTKRPLDSSQCIAIQCSNYKSLFFRRRYFLVFQNQFDEIDSCLHVFRDIKYNYNHGPVQAKEENVIQLARFIIYGQAKNIDEAKRVSISETAREYLPKSMKKAGSSLIKKISNHIETTPPLDRLQAMMEFIKAVRQLPGFGCETFHARLTCGTIKDKKVDIIAGPRGLKVTEPDSDEIVLGIHILKITSYMIRGSKFILKFNNEKGENTAFFKMHKLEHIYTFIKDNHSLLHAHYSGLRKLRKEKTDHKDNNEDIIDGQYRTLADAEKALQLLNEEVSSFGTYDFNSSFLPICTENDDFSVDDYSSFNELELIHQFSTLEEDLEQKISRYHPKIISELLVLESAEKSLLTLQKELSLQLSSIFSTKIKDAVVNAETSMHYAMSIKETLKYPDIEKMLKIVVVSLQAFFISTKESDARHAGITEIKDLVSNHLKSSIDTIPSIIEVIREKKSQIPPPEEIESGLIKSLQRGSLFLFVSHQIILSIETFLYENRLSLFSYGLDIRKFLPAVSNYGIKIWNVWTQIANNTFENSSTSESLNNVFREINPFMRSFVDSNSIPKDFQEQVEKRLLDILRISWGIQQCFMKPGEEFLIKFYPGSLSLMYQSFNAMSDIESILTTLSNYPFVKSNKDLEAHIVLCLDSFKKTTSKLLKLGKEQKDDPTNESVRCSIIQTINEVKRNVLGFSRIMSPYLQQVDISQQLQVFFISMDDFLVSLSPMNVSPQRVETASKSLSVLIETLKGKGISGLEVTSIENILGNFNKWLPLISTAPTNGSILRQIHMELHNSLREIIKNDSYFSSSDDEVIPIVIELLVPSIKKALANPDFDDDFEFCLHIPLFCQMHLNISRLITYMTNVLSAPQIKIQEDLVNEMRTRIDSLVKLYSRLTQIRPNLLHNPYTFSELFPITNLLNKVKVSIANMIIRAKGMSSCIISKIPYILISNVSQSIDAFIQMTKKLQIRPYREVPTGETILTYRKFLIAMAKIMKDSALTCPQNLKSIVEQEDKLLMDLVKEVSKCGRTPSHAFDDLVVVIDKHIDDCFNRTQTIPGLWNDQTLEKVNDMIKANHKVIEGTEPTTFLLEKLVNDLILNIKNLPQSLAKFGSDSVIQTILAVFNQILDYLERFMMIKQYAHSHVLSMKYQLVWYYHLLPSIPEILKDDIGFQTCLVGFCDLINLTRQMPLPSSIQFKWQKLENSISDEIPELAEVVVEQMVFLEEIFSSIKTHPLITSSTRLSKLLSQIHNFYDINVKLLKKPKEEVEKMLEQYTKEVEPTLVYILSRVKLLHPILSDQQLIQSCEALLFNVNKIIDQFCSHRLTTNAAQVFKTSTIIEIESLKELLYSIVQDPIFDHKMKATQFVHELFAILCEIPQDVTNLKTSMIQKYCDKVYLFTKESFPSVQSQLDSTLLSEKIINLSRNIELFISIPKTRLLHTYSLTIRAIPISKDVFESIFSEFDSIALSNSPNASSTKTKELNQIFETIATHYDCLPNHLNFACQSLKPIISIYAGSYLFDFIRFFSHFCAEIFESEKKFQQCILKCAQKAVSFVNPIMDVLKSVAPKSEYHVQLNKIIVQMDISMFQKFGNLPSLFMIYSSLHQISSLSLLTLIDSQEYNTHVLNFNRNISELDRALLSVVFYLIEQLTIVFEKYDVFGSFVKDCMPLLRSSFRGLSFNSSAALIISNVYLSFDASNSQTITEIVKKHPSISIAISILEKLSSYKPIILQWANPSASRQIELVKANILGTSYWINSRMKEFKTHLASNIMSVPFYYSEIRSLLFDLIQTINSAKVHNNDVSIYEEPLKEVEKYQIRFDTLIHQIFVECMVDSAQKELFKMIIQLTNSINTLIKLSGPIPLIQQQVVEQKVAQSAIIIETVKEEEKFVNPYDEIRNIALSIFRKDYSAVLRIVEEIEKTIKIKGQGKELHQWFQIAKNAATSKSQSVMSQFLRFAAEYLNDKYPLPSELKTINEINTKFFAVQHQFNSLCEKLSSSKLEQSDIHSFCEHISTIQFYIINSFKLFECISPSIYTFFYQTSEQIWQNIMNMTKEIGETARKKNIRATSRLLDELCYIVEDATLQDKVVYSKPIEKSKDLLFSNTSLFFMDISAIVLSFSISDFPDLYNKRVSPYIQSLKIHYDLIHKSSATLISMNKRKNISTSFSEQFSMFNGYFAKFPSIISNISTIDLLLSTCQLIQSCLFSMTRLASLMTDEIDEQPDELSASRIAQRFSIPDMPKSLNQLKPSIALGDSIKEYQVLYTKMENFKSKLFRKGLPNQELVTETNILCQQSTIFLESLLKVSVTISNIEFQSQFASSISEFVSVFNTLLKSIRSKFVLRPTWESDAEECVSSLPTIMSRIIKNSQNAIHVMETESVAVDQMKKKVLELAQPFIATQNQMNNISAQIQALSNSIQREFSLSLLDIASSVTATYVKIIVYLKDHMKESTISIDDLSKVFSSISPSTDQTISIAFQVVTKKDEEFEDDIIKAGGLVIQCINSLLRVFSSKTSEGIALISTLTTISEATNSLINTSKETKKKRIEKHEAAQKRAELIAQRKQASEERKKNRNPAISEKRTVMTSQIKSKDQLMQRLALESRVIRARLLVAEHERRVQELA